MPAAALVLVLAAALFHSCWNALTKNARDQFAFLCLAVAVASVLFLPVTLWALPPGGVPAAAWPYVIATIVRALLVPATMRLMGRWNWWRPW